MKDNRAIAAVIWVRTLACICALVLALGSNAMPASAKPRSQRTQEGGMHPAVPTGDLYGRLDFGDQNRKYLVHFPPSYDASRPYPLVICLHGGGGDIGFARRMFGMNEKADKEGFIVAYPNGSGRLGDHVLTWNAILCCGYAEARNIDDVAFMRAFLNALEGEHNIDQKRVYLAGFSNGAMMAYRLASELPSKWAAVGIVSGSMNGHEARPAMAVPMMIIHGTKDKHIPVEGGPGKLAKWGFDVHAKPLDYAVNFWVNADGCNPEPKVERDGIVERKEYAGGKNDSEVIVYTIDGYAHSWPGGNRAWLLADTPAPAPELSATDKCWEFFSKHTR